MELIEISPHSEDIILSLAYASENNFTGRKIYSREACFLRKEAFTNFTKAVKIAENMGYKIKIFDAFRPTEAQKIMWNFNPDPRYIANPDSGSPHSRGVAVDLTLCSTNNDELDMGTDFDSFSPKSHHNYLDLPKKVLHNRSLLLGIMTLAGWDFFINEWWHYQLFKPKQYSLLTDKMAGTNMI